MVELEKASLGDLLLLFLYIEILSMVKGSALGSREIPIRTPWLLPSWPSPATSWSTSST